MVTAVQIHLLGEFALLECAIRCRLSTAAQRVLAFCALHSDVSSRQVVAGSLWPDLTDDAAGRRLRTALWRVSTASTTVIVADRSNVRLADGVEVDLNAARTTDPVITREGDGRSIDQWLTLLQKDLLPHWDDEWLVAERERWRQQRLHRLERTAWALGLAGRYAEAVDVALIAIQAEPVRESAHRTLVRLHLAEGNISEACRHAAVFTALCRAELGVDPTQDFQDLVARAEIESNRPLPGRGDGTVTA